MSLRKSVRGQSGPELLIVYAFVILSLALAFILLYNMGVFTNLFDRTCARDARGFSYLNPVDWGVYYQNNEVKARMRNDAGMTIEVTGGFASFEGGIVNCSIPSSGSQIIMGPGDSVTINLSCTPPISNQLPDGDCYALASVFNYTNVDNDMPWKSKGTFRGGIEKSA
jgi:hypothetical protein